MKSALLKGFRTSAKPVIVGMLAAAFVVLPERASALDYKVSFNQTPYYTFGSFDSNGNITYQLSSAIDGSLRAWGDYEVEALIMNLENNLSHQSPASIAITKASHDPLSIGIYTFMQGNGFDVSHGEITRAFWIGLLNAPSYQRRLIFRPPHGFAVQWVELDHGPQSSIYSYTEDGYPYVDSQPIGGGMCACSFSFFSPPPGSAPSISLLNTPTGNPPLPPVTPTPGPLPIMGAVAAYRASRNLRRRIQQA
jgi:hypothetical protein